MDKDFLNSNIAEKIADIFQTYTHIALETEDSKEIYLNVEILFLCKEINFYMKKNNTEETESLVPFHFENEEEYEEVLSNLKNLEKKLDEILKEVRR